MIAFQIIAPLVWLAVRALVALYLAWSAGREPDTGGKIFYGVMAVFMLVVALADAFNHGMDMGAANAGDRPALYRLMGRDA